MAKQNFSHYVKRDQPKKRGPRQHKKNLNKSEKRQQSQKRYLGQGQDLTNIPLYPIYKGMKEITNRKEYNEQTKINRLWLG